MTIMNSHVAPVASTFPGDDPISQYARFCDSVAKNIPDSIVQALKRMSPPLDYDDGLLAGRDVQWDTPDPKMPVTFCRPTVQDGEIVFLPMRGQDLVPSARAPHESFLIYNYGRRHVKAVAGHRAHYLKCIAFTHTFYRLFGEGKFVVHRDFWARLKAEDNKIFTLFPTMEIKFTEITKFVLDFDAVNPEDAAPLLTELTRVLGPNSIRMTFWRQKAEDKIGLHVFTPFMMSVPAMKRLCDRVHVHLMTKGLICGLDGNIYTNKLRAPGCFGSGKKLPPFNEFYLTKCVSVPFHSDEVDTFDATLLERLIEVRRSCQTQRCKSKGVEPFWHPHLCVTCIVGIWDIILNEFYPCHINQNDRQVIERLSNNIPLIAGDQEEARDLKLLFRDEFPCFGGRIHESPYSFMRTAAEGEKPVPFRDLASLVHRKFDKLLRKPFSSMEEFSEGWGLWVSFLSSLQKYMVSNLKDKGIHGFVERDDARAAPGELVVKQINKGSTLLSTIHIGGTAVFSFPGCEKVAQRLSTLRLVINCFSVKASKKVGKKDPTLTITVLNPFLTKLIEFFKIEPSWRPYPLFRPPIELQENPNNTFVPQFTKERVAHFVKEFERGMEGMAYAEGLQELAKIFIFFYDILLSGEDKHHIKVAIARQIILDLAAKVMLPNGDDGSAASPPHLVILLGAQGSGKTLFSTFMMAVFGLDHVTFPSAADATNPHASAYLEKALIAVYDEAKAMQTSKNIYDQMKASTNATISINAKFQDIKTIRNTCFRIWVANLDMTSIGYDINAEDRRLLVAKNEYPAPKERCEIFKAAIEHRYCGPMFNWIAVKGVPEEAITYVTQTVCDSDEHVDLIHDIFTAISRQAALLDNEDKAAAAKEIYATLTNPAPVGIGKLNLILNSCPTWSVIVLNMMLNKGINNLVALNNCPSWIYSPAFWETSVWCKIVPLECLHSLECVVKNTATGTRSSLSSWEGYLKWLLPQRYITVKLADIFEEGFVPPEGGFMIESPNGDKAAYIGTLEEARKQWCTHTRWDEFDNWSPRTEPSPSHISPTLTAKALGQVRKGISNYGNPTSYVPPPPTKDNDSMMEDKPFMQISALAAFIKLFSDNSKTAARILDVCEAGFDAEYMSLTTENDTSHIETYVTKRNRSWEQAAVRIKRSFDSVAETIPVSSRSSSSLDSQEVDFFIEEGQVHFRR